jgi:transcriptional regulator with XRE-family HTH domain
LHTARVGEQLRRYREAQGFSQAELGRRLGVTGPTISRYETGEMQIDADELPRFAVVLGVSPAQFFDVPEIRSSAPDLTSAGAAFLSGIEDALERLPTHDRESVEQILGLITHVLREAG